MLSENKMSNYQVSMTNEQADRRISCLYARLAIIGGLILVIGCRHGDQTEAPKISDKPIVKTVKPELRTITREVGQPSFVDAYEQTAIYAKLPGYIEEWNVDIGDSVKKGDVLATLFIPELVEEHRSKLATVEEDRALVDQAKRMVDVAAGNCQASAADVAEAKANIGKFEAAVERWTSEVKRLSAMAKENVIDQQVLDESTRQLRADTASRDAAAAAIDSAKANLISSEATLAKAKVDVDVAQARLKVAESEEQRVAALVGYTKLVAPYDGVVVVRNANTGDFILPAGGDPSAASTSPDQSGTRATPVYVLARTDIVRVFVDVPEGDADFVKKGSKGSVTVKALANDPIEAAVTRTSWALRVKSRTLRAEIDLPNADARLLPGMYAYGKILIERTNTLAVPRSSIEEQGEHFCCYLYENGKAVRTPVQTGISNDGWIEVTAKQVPSAKDDGSGWTPFTGKEIVILGDFTELSDGQQVEVQP